MARSPVGRGDALLAGAATRYLLFSNPGRGRLDPRAPDRLIAAAEAGAGMAYADYAEVVGERYQERPLNDYQSGSLRDGFRLRPSRSSCRGQPPAGQSENTGSCPPIGGPAGPDLRLKISADHDLFHLPERLSLVDASVAAEAGTGDRELFAYVDPRNRPLQEEMEAAATAHLKRIGAWLAPGIQ